MIVPQDANILKDVLAKANTVYVLLSTNPTYDSIASGLALYLTLKETGKTVQIASTADMRVEFSHVVGVDEVKQKIGNRNLMVSFAYEENSVDKVSYSISEDSKKFNLIIAPKSGAKPLDPTQVEYSYTGAEAEVVFMVGTTSFEDLGELYEAEHALYTSAFTINIAPFPVQPCAQLSVDTSGQSSVAEGVAVLLRALDLEAKDDIATNLLSAIEHATQRFQSLGTTAETLEVAAQLMRQGARRSSAANPAFPHAGASGGAGAGMPAGAGAPATAVPTTAFAQTLRARSGAQQHVLQQNVQQYIQQQPQQVKYIQQKPLPMNNVSQVQQGVQTGANAPQVLNTQQIYQLEHAVPTENSDTLFTQDQLAQNPPEDWTKPKVFTGATRV